MDALSDVLDSLKLKAVVYQKTSFTSAWGIAIGQDQYSQFWRLLKGCCYVRIAGEELIKIRVGDFVFVPHGAAHKISGGPDDLCVPSPQFVQALNSGQPMFQGNEEETLLIGGHFEFTSPTLHPFVQSLPKVIRLSNADAEIGFWLRRAGSFINEEVNTEQAGSRLILGRLAEIVFILIIRAYLEKTTVEKGFLHAFKDPRISSSLKAMHTTPAKDWTLSELASSAGMSRSLYCKEFKRLTGATPLGYLTDWRIIKAKEFMLNKKETIRAIAERVGYQSEAAFNRVFKAKVGETPASYRRRIMAGAGLD